MLEIFMRHIVILGTLIASGLRDNRVDAGGVISEKLLHCGGLSREVVFFGHAWKLII